jgi:hypothetical protein
LNGDGCNGDERGPVRWSLALQQWWRAGNEIAPAGPLAQPKFTASAGPVGTRVGFMRAGDGDQQLPSFGWPRCRSRPTAAGLELPTAPVRASGSASVAWTSAPIERLLFAGTQWPVAFACSTMPTARHGTVPYAHCNHDAPRRMAEDATVRNRRLHHHFASSP